AHHREPGQQGMALEDHGAVEAGAVDLPVGDDDGAVARLGEAGQHLEDGGLAAAGMADQADELAAVDAEPDVLEHAGLVAVAEAARQAFDADEGAFHWVIPDRSRAW